MNRLIFLFLLCIISSSQIYSQFSPGTPLDQLEHRNSRHYIDQLPEYHSFINWTTGELVTDYRVPVTFRDANIGRRIMNLTDKLKKKMLLFTIEASEKIIISSVSTLGDYFQQNEQLKLKLLAKLHALPVENPVFQGSNISGTITVPLFGVGSISEIFYSNIKPRLVTEFLKKETISAYSYDTLIIDMVMFPQFNASVAPKIYNQKGQVVHGIETVSTIELEKHSPVYYVTSITEALAHPIRGKKIVYVLPHAISGSMSSDIVLFDVDVEKIYAQQRTIEHLYQARVIVIKPKETI